MFFIDNVYLYFIETDAINILYCVEKCVCLLCYYGLSSVVKVFLYIFYIQRFHHTTILRHVFSYNDLKKILLIFGFDFPLKIVCMVESIEIF